MEHEAGIHLGWDTRPSHDTMHTHSHPGQASIANLPSGMFLKGGKKLTRKWGERQTQTITRAQNGARDPGAARQLMLPAAQLYTSGQR